jgi:hypothetical protein
MSGRARSGSGMLLPAVMGRKTKGERMLDSSVLCNATRESLDVAAAQVLR